MGYRLSKISTRTGDSGMTGLGDGSRVEKDHMRVHAMGDIDECNSLIGLLLCEPLPEDIRVL
ncbi:MAG: ATP:cob(I)alamin adenosyltransferase, partial [Burkholderiales bacterium]|nr:ATP:cob(I)alamin adenosyltransferase [Burkholderiales bacterium]